MTKEIIDRENQKEKSYQSILKLTLGSMDELIKGYDEVTESGKNIMKKLWINRLGRDLFLSVEFDSDYVWVHKDRVKKTVGRKRK